MITQERLKELFKYDPDTGLLTRSTGFNNVKIGDIAGTLRYDGYLHIKIDGKLYLCHRLAWVYMYGDIPENIDHINHIRDDNRIVNIRNVSKLENNRNQSIMPTNTSGVTGVSWHKTLNKWRCFINVNNKQVHLGVYDDFELACLVRKEANIKYGFHSNHGGNNG